MDTISLINQPSRIHGQQTVNGVTVPTKAKLAEGAFDVDTPPNFSKVKRAKALLKAKAEEYAKLYEAAIKKAMEEGNSDAAIKGIQWFMEHVEDEDGTRLISQGVDKPKEAKQIASGPTLNIGFKIGGLTEAKQLPEAQIEVVEIKDKD